MVEELNDINALKIIMKIEEYCNTGLTMMESIVEYSDVSGIEIEVLADIVNKNPNIKAKIEEEAQTLNLVEKSKKSKLNV